MRALTETDNYIASIQEQSEAEETKNTVDLLGDVKEVFSSLTSAVKDLEKIMITLNISQTNQEEEVAETEVTEEV